MNLTASSWFHNYFCEAMDNVIQDSKGKNLTFGNEISQKTYSVDKLQNHLIKS